MSDNEKESNIERFISLVNNMEPDLKKALDEDKSGITVDKFISVLIFYIKKNIKLLEYDQQSLVNSIRDAASEGILIDGREGYLFPAKSTLKFGAMVSGIVKKLAIAGVSVNPQVVYKNDKFEYWTDENGQHIRHYPDILGVSGQPRGDMIGAYSIAETKEGFKHIEIMSKEEINKVKSKSNNKDGLMWTEFPDEGAKKSVIRRGYKWLPKNPKLDSFFKREDEDEYDYENQIPEVKAIRTSSRIEEIINNKGAADNKPIVNTPSSPVLKPKEEIQHSPTGDRIQNQYLPDGGSIEGIVIKVGINDSDKNNIRYICKIGEIVLGTELKEMYNEAILPLFEQKKTIRVHFTKRETSDIVYNDIFKIEDLTPKENVKNKKDLPL